MGRSIHYLRNGGNLLFLVNYVDPATGVPYESGAGANEVSAVACRILDPSTTPSTVLVGTTAAAFDTAAKQWKLSRPVTDIPAGTRVIIFEAVPTRGGGIAAALWPEVRLLIDVTSLVQDVDDVDVNVLTKPTGKFGP